MCSQYEITKPLDYIIARAQISLDPSLEFINFAKHIYPFSQAPVITRYQDRLSLRLMQYSLIPHWSTSARPKFTTYNARLDRPGKAKQQLELIYETPTWRLPFQEHRCLIPLTGFFESCRSGSHAGNIVKFAAADEEILWAAGVWSRWTDPTNGEIIDSFAILTDDPIDFILSVGHDRQPVFLSLEQAQHWLNTQELPAAAAYNFLKTHQHSINYRVINHRPLKNFSPSYDLFQHID